MSEPRRFVNQLGHQEQVAQVFRASDKQLRPNRNGNLYLQVDLSDRSGTISARLWNASEQDHECFANGDYIHVEGATQLFQGTMQMIAKKVRKAESSEVVEDDFVVRSDLEIDRMATRLGEILRSLSSPPLSTLAECYLMDESFMAKFTKAPAGIKNHHAYLGGLLEHVLSLMELVLIVTPRYPQLDVDLLLLGVLVHDSGKIDELLYEKDLAYSDEGQLLGHITLGMRLLDEKIAEAERLSGEPISNELALQLRHLIVSHHGEYEYGSPTLPMTLEALVLHHLDNLDAKIHHFSQLMADDANVGSRWTQYHPNLRRKLYKKPEAASSEP